MFAGVSDRGQKQISPGRHYIDFPYLGKHTKPAWRSIVGNSKVAVCYHRLPKLGRLLSTRFKIPKLEQTGVVYHFVCVVNPKVSYVGMTMRRLGCRVKEHKHVTSPVGQHLLSCKPCCEGDLGDKFSILGQAHNFWELARLEAALIEAKKPNLNTQIGAGAQTYNLHF